MKEKNTPVALLHHPCIYEETLKWFEKEFGYSPKEFELDLSPPNYQIDDPKYKLDPLNEMVVELGERLRERRMQLVDLIESFEIPESSRPIQTIRLPQLEAGSIEWPNEIAPPTVESREEVTKGIFEDLRDHIKVDPNLPDHTIMAIGEKDIALVNVETGEAKKIDKSLQGVWEDMKNE